jgi:hypothetical protein
LSAIVVRILEVVGWFKDREENACGRLGGLGELLDGRLWESELDTSVGGTDDVAAADIDVDDG